MPAQKNLGSENVVQIYRNVRHGKRVIITGDASTKVAKHPIMDLVEAVIIKKPATVEFLDPKERGEYVFKHLDSGFESFDNLMHDPRPSSVRTFEHPLLQLLLGLNRWEIREREEVFTLKMSALIHELLPAFIIDDPCDGVREGTPFRITWSAGTNQVCVDHPPATEPENRVQPHRQRVHFAMGGRMHIGAAIGPSSE